jgi:hypothetical protein
MFSPGMALGAVLLLSSVSISALDLSLDVTYNSSEVVVDGRAVDLPETELLNRIKSGSTIRLTWVFRIDGVEEAVVRYARRDPLSEGVLVYGPDRHELVSPVPPDRVGQVLSSLDGYRLSSQGPWGAGTVLEARLFLDSDLLYPPMSLTTLFRGLRERSAWRTVTLSGAVSR